MTDGDNRGSESAEKKKGMFSLFKREQAVESATDQHAVATRSAEGDGENPLPSGPAAGVDPGEAADASPFARLRRAFSRQPARQPEVAESRADGVVAPCGEATTITIGDTAAVPPAQPGLPVEAMAGVSPEPVSRVEPDVQPADVAVELPASVPAAVAVTGTELEAAPVAALVSEKPAVVENTGIANPVGAVALPAAEPAEPPRLPALSVENQAKQQRFGRIKQALSRTRKGLGRLFLGKKQIDDDLLEELETLLLTADLGVDVTSDVIRELTDRVKRKELNDVDALQSALRNLLVEILKPCEIPLDIGAGAPFVLMAVGVNGVGKTTTIGKLAKLFLNQGRTVMLAAGDTFRAAAVEQLQIWGERNQVPVIAQHTGADSASVIYDAVESARARQTRVLIADTAGRLHTKSNLMDELKKIKRVVGKLDGTAPHEVLLVLDAGTGQNAVAQLQQFHEAVGVTGIVLTKLDGTAKGGIIFALCRRFAIPVRYIGVGEGVDDLQPFRAEDFVDALLASDNAPHSTQG